MKGKALRRSSILLTMISPFGFTAAADQAQDKSRYNLLSPTPESLLREFATDRPDKTEGPTTVNAGHFQFEMDFPTFRHDETGSPRRETWNIAPFNLRIGLLNNIEMSLILDSYLREDIDDRPTRTMSILSGIGDFTTRLKINLWGNDGGQSACAFFHL